MTAILAPKKVRYHDRDTNRFAWAYPDDVPEYARVAAAADPLPEPEKFSDYSADIEQFLAELRSAAEDIRSNRNANEAHTRRARADEFRQAIDIYRAAELIPAVTVQFGSYRADWGFRCPPQLDEYTDIAPWKQASQHRYVTADPVEIAYLRTLNDLEEVPVGYVYSRAPGGRDGIWVPLDTYLAQQRIGQAA